MNSREVFLAESMHPQTVWRHRDDEAHDWLYSEVPVNPEKWRYVEVFRSLYYWVDGFRETG